MIYSSSRTIKSFRLLKRNVGGNVTIELANCKNTIHIKTNGIVHVTTNVAWKHFLVSCSSCLRNLSN